jgi:hypothetical protein
VAAAGVEQQLPVVDHTVGPELRVIVTPDVRVQQRMRRAGWPRSWLLGIEGGDAVSIDVIDASVGSPC